MTKLTACILTAILLAFTAPAWAGSEEEEMWKFCDQPKQCISVEHCGMWIPVNKKYVESVTNTFTAEDCDGNSVELTPKPPSSCVSNVCVNDLSETTPQ